METVLFKSQTYWCNLLYFSGFIASYLIYFVHCYVILGLFNFPLTSFSKKRNSRRFGSNYATHHRPTTELMRLASDMNSLIRFFVGLFGKTHLCPCYQRTLPLIQDVNNQSISHCHLNCKLSGALILLTLLYRINCM